MNRPETLNAQKIIGYKFKKQFQYVTTQRDCILYALSIGFNKDPLKTKDFKFTYERDDDFTLFPTYASVIKKILPVKQLAQVQLFPKDFNPNKILHATQKLEMIHLQLKPNTKYITRGQIIDIQDKVKMTYLIIQLNSYQVLENGKQDLAFIHFEGVMVMGYGGFGYSGNKSFKQIGKQPQRNCDIILNEQTFPNQALFYRLCGDDNPIHVDPKATKSSIGIDKPILHGLCSYGIVARSICQNLLGYDVKMIKSNSVRFTGHVFCGQKFEIKVWNISNNEKNSKGYYFTARVIQRNKMCLAGQLQIRQTGNI